MKIGLSVADGFARAETLNWNVYNESADLIPHAELYRKLYGQVDKFYGTCTNANRKWCKDRNIRMTVIPKGQNRELTHTRNGNRERSSMNGML